MELTAFSGYYLEERKLKESASGGAATILAESILKEGGVVFGVSYTKDFKAAVYTCVDSLEGLSVIKGTKYIPSNKYMDINGEKKQVFEVVASKLQSGKDVLFTGVGCDIGALVFYLESHGIDVSNLYTIDLICHGPTNSNVQKKYIEELESKYKSKVTNFNLRYKKEGWVPPYIHVEFENGKKYEISFYDSDYCYAFGVYSKKSCYNCKFKGNNHKADVTIGDYWGLTEDMPGYNQNGVSVFLVRTDKGMELLNKINRNAYFLSSADVQHIIENNPMYYKCREKSPKWEAFDEEINKNGLKSAVIKSNGGVFKYYLPKIKKYVKGLLNKG